MIVFQYLTFVCEQSDLQTRLTEAGLEGWRLHTCEPVVMTGPSGSGLLNVLVVLDRVMDAPGEEAVVEDSAPEGIAMG